jgi:hypothetical protein
VSTFLDASHLPGLAGDAGLVTVAQRDGVHARAMPMTTEVADTVCRHLLHARTALEQVPVARVIDAIDSAARRLCDPAEPARDDVLRGLQAFTGYAPAMAGLVLDRMCQDWMRAPLHRLVTAEFGDAAPIESFCDRPGSPGVQVRAVAPPLGLHVFAGNVPGVSVTSIIRALLVRSAVFGKSAAGEPVLAPAFARLLFEADPAVGRCVAVTYWPGGSTDIEAAVLRHAGLVVHYGGGDAIASLRSRAAAGTLFVEHGPRISFAVVDSAGFTRLQGAGGRAAQDAAAQDAAAQDAAAQEAAADLARAVALFDQQGCVSPQTAYVIGDPASAHAFAERVATCLHDIAAVLPRGRLEPGEAAAIRDLRTRAEFRAIGGSDVKLWTGSDLAWTVIAEPDPAFGGSCLNRTLIVRSAPSLDALIDLVRPFSPLLQTVGLAGFADEELAAVASRLGTLGVTRFAPIRDMPWPPATWHHDGRGPLRELVRWIDLER